MPAVVNHPRASQFAAVVSPLVDLVNRGLVHQAEALLAAVMLWALGEVEAGRLEREQANDLFTQLDVNLTNLGGETPLADAAQELLFEGEHFHHFGEEHGPDPAYLRELANGILSSAPH